MATASTFSYAQAAKGQGTSTQTSTPSQNSQSENGAAAPAADKSAEPQTNATETSPQYTKPDAPSAISEKQDIESVSARGGGESRPESVQDRRPESRRDDDAGRLDRPWRRNDKGTRSSSTTTRSAEEQDSRRPRKGKKGRSSEKQSAEGSSVTTDQDQKEEPEAPKIQLAEAPIPAVNIWQQRKQSQQSKVVTEPATNGTSEHAHKEQAEVKPPSNSTASPVIVNGGGKAYQKASDKPERNGSRGNRTAGRETREAKPEVPPPVDDAASWPTPETAIKEEKKKPADKPEPIENSQQESAPAKPRHKKEWRTYDYVPSVAFETPLAPMRGSKPRGGAKGASGSRSVAGAQNGEKTAATAPTKNESRDRHREASNGTTRTTSLPPVNKRASIDGSNARGEQKKPAHHAGAEKVKDAAAGQGVSRIRSGKQSSQHMLKPSQDQQHHHHHSAREGRTERGRGGYRGRGGHHTLNSHSQHQHTAPSMNAPAFQPNGSLPLRQGPHSSPPRQGHGQMYMPASQRGGRGGRNGGSNYQRMSLPNASSRLPPVQTQFAPFEYPVGPMTAMPFSQQQQQPYWDDGFMKLVIALRDQIEYYFSFNALLGDTYMREHMDSQGFVHLTLVAGFNRLKSISTDLSLVRRACEESNEIDYVVGEDSVERLRPRKDWAKLVLDWDKRREPGKSHGPMQLTWKSRHYFFNSQFNGMPPSPYGMMASPPAYTPQGYYPGFSGENHGLNGFVNGYGGASQLSADVPDFAPSLPVAEPGNLVDGHAPVAAVNGMTNGDHSQDAGQS